MSAGTTHPAALDDAALLAQCSAVSGRASGPGGQHRNKVETAVVLTHTPTGVHAQASERRSQVENKRIALRRLRLHLAVEHREAPRRATGLDEIASDLWRRRRQGERLPCNTENKDYPALLAEAMDVLADSGWDPKKAGLRLGVTPTQLVRLCKGAAPAIARVNEGRKAMGLHALH
jgi:RF-1 domain